MARSKDLADTPLESAVQRKIIQRYEKEGYLVVKIDLCNKPGFPDLMLLKDGKASFVEVKRPGGKVRPLQEYRHRQLRDLGFDVSVMKE